MSVLYCSFAADGAELFESYFEDSNSCTSGMFIGIDIKNMPDKYQANFFRGDFRHIFGLAVLGPSDNVLRCYD